MNRASIMSPENDTSLKKWTILAHRSRKHPREECIPDQPIEMALDDEKLQSSLQGFDALRATSITKD